MSFIFGCVFIWMAIVVISSDGNPRKWVRASGPRSERNIGIVFMIASAVLLATGVWLVR